MPLYLKITTPKEWVQGDYTDNATNDINATVYSDPQMQNTVDLTAADTLIVKLFDPNVRAGIHDTEIYSSDSVITGDASGVATIRFTQSDSPDVYGFLKLRIVYKDSTQRLTAIGVSGSDEIFIKRR